MTTEISLRCPECLDLYSKERCPLTSPQCGHSICKPCADRLNSNDCVNCKQKSYYVLDHQQIAWHSSQWPKNYALVEMVQLQEKAQQTVREEQMECSGCKSMERKEKLKICDTCASEWEMDWTLEEEEKVIPFVLCAFCCTEKHKDHEWVNFWPWRLQKLVSSTVVNGKSAVSDGHYACFDKLDITEKQLDEWNKLMDNCLGLKFHSYQHGVSIANRLKREADRVMESSDECLPKLAKYRKVVQESSKCLKDIQKACIEATSVYVEKAPLDMQQDVLSICYDYVNYVRFTVSAPVTLCALRMTGVAEDPHGAKGKTEIYDNEFHENTLNDQFECPLWKGVDELKMTPITPPVEMWPGTDYLLKFFVDESTELFYQDFCIKQETVHELTLPDAPPSTVTVCEYFDHTTKAENKNWQLAGFYFSPTPREALRTSSKSSLTSILSDSRLHKLSSHHLWSTISSTIVVLYTHCRTFIRYSIDILSLFIFIVRNVIQYLRGKD